MGAPQHNQNAMTHGVRRSLAAAQSGHRARRLPKGYRYVGEEVSKYAGSLYRDVEAIRGGVDREAMETIEAAAAWHQHALYVLRVMRVEGEELKPEIKVAFSEAVAKAAQRRADLVRLLKLNESHHADPLDALIVQAGQRQPDASPGDSSEATADHSTEPPANHSANPVATAGPCDVAPVPSSGRSAAASRMAGGPAAADNDSEPPTILPFRTAERTAE